MSKIDVIKENLQFQQLLRENSSTAILREEYLIPDTHPDVQQILSIEARPIITNKDIIGDKVVMEGRVEYTVLYIPREDYMVVNSVNYTEKFTSSLDLNEGEHKVVCEIECKVEHIDARIMNERKISIEGVIALNWELYKTVEFDFVRDIEASEGVETLKNVESINRLAASKETELIGKSMLRVGMDKPQINKILNCSLMLHKKEIKLAEDKIYLGCYCKINILYIGGDSKELINLEDDVYISKEEEEAGITPDMIPSMSCEIKNSDINIEEDDLGESRIVNTEFLVKAIIKVFSDEDIDVIKDAYSPKFQMDIKKDIYDIGVMLGTQGAESIIRDNIYLGEEDLKPEKVVNVCGNTIITDKDVSDNKITIEGIIRVNIIYKASEGDIGFGSISGDIPFTAVLDVADGKEGMKAIVKCALEGIEANLEANTIAIKATLGIASKSFYEVSKEFISDVIEGEEESKKKNSSITIYVIGKDDSLWNLAKKYNTTVKELVNINNLDHEDNIKEGEKILIPGRALF